MFLKSKNLTLRPFTDDLIGPEYISWLNDPEINLYSQRSLHPTSEAEARAYLKGLGPHEKVLAILSHGKHVGNIKYGPVDWINRRADISIMVGDKNVWGKGVASGAIYLVSKHLFENLGLERLEAGSFNPAFITSVVKNLGWTQEGKLRRRIFLRNEFHDYTLVSMLRGEFKILPSYEG